MKRVKKVSKNIWDIIMQPEMIQLPGHLAFFIVLSIFPILMLIGVIASFFNLSVANLVNLIHNSLPKDISNIIIPYIQGKSFDGNILLFSVIGFILASNGTHAITLASNSMYHFKNNSYIRRRIKALFMIILFVLLFVFMLGFLAFGNQLYQFIVHHNNIDYINNLIFWLFAILKWPFAMFIVFFNVKLLYTMAPDEIIASRTTTKGALFTTFGWTISTFIFSLYIRCFGHYDIFYGSMANIIVVMIWIYILSFIFVIGIGINVKNSYITIEKDHNTK